MNDGLNGNLYPYRSFYHGWIQYMGAEKMSKLFKIWIVSWGTVICLLTGVNLSYAASIQKTTEGMVFGDQINCILGSTINDHWIITAGAIKSCASTGTVGGNGFEIELNKPDIANQIFRFTFSTSSNSFEIKTRYSTSGSYYKITLSTAGAANLYKCTPSCSSSLASGTISPYSGETSIIVMTYTSGSDAITRLYESDGTQVFTYTDTSSPLGTGKIRIGTTNGTLKYFYQPLSNSVTVSGLGSYRALLCSTADALIASDTSGVIDVTGILPPIDGYVTVTTSGTDCTTNVDEKLRTFEIVGGDSFTYLSSQDMVLGPRVANVGSTTAKIWAKFSPDANGKTMKVQYKTHGTSWPDSSCSSNCVAAGSALSSTDNYTDAVELTGLSASAEYDCRVYADSTVQGTSECNFTTHVGSGDTTLKIGFGSCLCTIKRPYDIFDVLNNKGLTLFILEGDNIYEECPFMVDDVAAYSSGATRTDGFRLKYDDVFRERKYNDFMSTNSVIGTLDDHEVDGDYDNGTGTSSYADAIDAYDEYIMQGNPSALVSGDRYWVKDVGNIHLQGYDLISHRDYVAAMDRVVYYGQGTNDGTLTNFADPADADSGWTTTGCAIGFTNCLHFDGTNDRVVSSVNPSTLTSWTIMVWVKLDATSGAQTFFSNDRAGWNDDILFGVDPEDAITTNNRIALVHQDNTSSVRTIVTDTIDANTNSVMAVVTSDGSSLKLYTNGTYKATTAKVGNDLSMESAEVWAGGNPGFGRYLNGNLSKVVLLNEVLAGPTTIGNNCDDEPNNAICYWYKLNTEVTQDCSQNASNIELCWKFVEGTGVKTRGQSVTGSQTNPSCSRNGTNNDYIDCTSVDFSAQVPPVSTTFGMVGYEGRWYKVIAVIDTDTLQVHENITCNPDCGSETTTIVKDIKSMMGTKQFAEMQQKIEESSADVFVGLSSKAVFDGTNSDGWNKYSQERDLFRVATGNTLNLNGAGNCNRKFVWLTGDNHLVYYSEPSMLGASSNCKEYELAASPIGASAYSGLSIGGNVQKTISLKPVAGIVTINTTPTTPTIDFEVVDAHGDEILFTNNVVDYTATSTILDVHDQVMSVVDDSGYSFILYRDSTTSFKIVKSEDDVGTFSSTPTSSISKSSVAYNTFGPTLAIDKTNNKLYVIYEDSAGYDVLIQSASFTSGLSWDSNETTIFNGTGSSDNYDAAGIILDSSGYIHVATSYYNGSKYNIVTMRSTAANNLTSWTYPVHHIESGAIIFPTIDSLGSGKIMMAMLESSTGYIYYNLYSNSLWAYTNISWTSATNTTASPDSNDLTKTGGADGTWDSDAVSTLQFASKGPGKFIRWKCGQTNKQLMAGLSADDPDANFNTIDFAVHCRQDGKLEVYENGTSKYGAGGTGATYTTSDIISIELNSSGYPVYKKNGTTLYTSLTLATYPLRVDTSIKNSNAFIDDMQIVGALNNVITSTAHTSTKYAPTVVSDGSGNAGIVFKNSTTPYPMQYSYYNGTSWDTPYTINTNEQGLSPTLAYAGSKWYAMYLTKDLIRIYESSDSTPTGSGDWSLSNIDTEDTVGKYRLKASKATGGTLQLLFDRNLRGINDTTLNAFSITVFNIDINSLGVAPLWLRLNREYWQ